MMRQLWIELTLQNAGKFPLLKQQIHVYLVQTQPQKWSEEIYLILLGKVSKKTEFIWDFVPNYG